MFQPGPQGVGGMGFGMISPPEQIIEAIVVDLGEEYREKYEDTDASEEVEGFYKQLPYKVGDTVFVPGSRPAFDIEGFTYIRWDNVICWRSHKENN